MNCEDERCFMLMCLLSSLQTLVTYNNMGSDFGLIAGHLCM